MRKAIALLFIALFFLAGNAFAQSDELVNTCALNIGNATYMKDFKVKLQQSSVKPPPSSKFSVLMNKGTIYKLNTCNADGYEGQAIVELYDGNKKITSNLQPDGSVKDAAGFFCQKSGVYKVDVYFKDGKEGAAVVILSFMQNK
ncbi:MAG: hypothetical protein R6U85_12125 [Salinivirgaceae bacterium]